MTTLTQFTGGHDGSGGPPNDRVDVVAIGGTASAGDWLRVTSVGGFDGAGLGDVVMADDVSGTTGWVVDFDAIGGTGSDQFRVIGWRKQCVGGETQVTATWAAASNHCIEGEWCHSLSLPALYLVSSGDAFFDPGSSSVRYQAITPLAAANSSVIGGVGFGRGGATEADFAPGSSCSTQGGDGTVIGSAVGAIAHYNTDEAIGTTPTLIYQLKPVQDAYMFWYAFSDAEPTVDLEGDGPLLLDGTGELTAEGGGVDVAGVGPLLLGGSGTLSAEQAELAGEGPLLLGGSGTLDVEGGNVNLAGVAPVILGGTGRLVAPAPHPVPGPPDLTDTLGCGLYEALVFTRGLGEIVGMLPFGEVDWGRVLDGVSTSQLTVDGVANRSQLQKCCRLLDEVEPFEHELALYRNGYRVWSGPITAMTFPPNQILISAFDLAGWLQRRTLHTDYNAVQVDLIDIWINYVQDAMAVDNSPGLHPTALALSGILADRLTQITEHNIAADAIGELERTGIDWTTVDRVMQAGPVLTQPPPITDALEFPLLIDESFRVPPTILLDGMQGANTWYVQGGGTGPAGAVLFGEYGPHFPATPDHVEQPAAPDYAEIEDQYGRLESVVSESRALDQASIDDNARSRYDLTKRPVAVISEGLLLPSAPIAMRKLIPGSLVQVHLANACKPIGDIYRIKAVTVQAHGDGSEDVNVQFQPLGTGTVLGTGDG